MTDVNRVEFDKPQTKAEERASTGDKGAGKPSAPKGPRIPKLPPISVDPEALKNPDMRAVACVNLRMIGTPFHEIAKELGYASPGACQQAYYRALASMFPVSNWETLRQEAAMRAEDQLRRSLAMATADFLVDSDTGEHIPNTDRRLWHDQANKDLALYVAITGAKAPTRVEISASTQELNQMVEVLLTAHGGEAEIEADVFEIDSIPTVDAEMIEE